MWRRSHNQQPVGTGRVSFLRVQCAANQTTHQCGRRSPYDGTAGAESTTGTLECGPAPYPMLAVRCGADHAGGTDESTLPVLRRECSHCDRRDRVVLTTGRTDS